MKKNKSLEKELSDIKDTVDDICFTLNIVGGGKSIEEILKDKIDKIYKIIEKISEKNKKI